MLPLPLAQVLRATSPPLALMTAQETALGGAFRAAHQRLVANAEEVAFNDPPAGMSEQMILNQHLYRLLRHSRLSAFQQFVQQSLDGFFIKASQQGLGLGLLCFLPACMPCPAVVPLQACAQDRLAHSMNTCSPLSPPPCVLQHYGATTIALRIYAAPLYWQGAQGFRMGRSQGEQTQDYISAMRLLSNTSK